MPKTIKPTMKDKCFHQNSMRNKNEFYCPDCGLSMTTEIKNGKKIGKSWIGEKNKYVPTTNLFYQIFRGI